jgi:hypothetical protein
MRRAHPAARARAMKAPVAKAETASSPARRAVAAASAAGPRAVRDRRAFRRASRTAATTISSHGSCARRRQGNGSRAARKVWQEYSSTNRARSEPASARADDACRRAGRGGITRAAGGLRHS